MKVLGIDVSESLLSAWSGWLAPEMQPFYLPAALASGVPAESASLTPELRDTFAVYRMAEDLQAVWLSEKVFAGLPKATRSTLVRAQVSCGRAAVPTVRSWSSVLDVDALRNQADGHRFVWWPNIVALAPATILGRVVSADQGTSRHAEMGEWSGDGVPGCCRGHGVSPEPSRSAAVPTVSGP